MQENPKQNWSWYKSHPKYKRELLDPSYQGVKRLFNLAFNNTENDNQVSVNSHQKYVLPRVNIESSNI